MTLKILQLVPESLPTFRPDVAVLFGKYLPRHGVSCDIVGMPSQQAPQAQPVHGMGRQGGGFVHGILASKKRAVIMTARYSLATG